MIPEKTENPAIEKLEEQVEKIDQTIEEKKEEITVVETTSNNDTVTDKIVERLETAIEKLEEKKEEVKEKIEEVKTEEVKPKSKNDMDTLIWIIVGILVAALIYYISTLYGKEKHDTTNEA